MHHLAPRHHWRQGSRIARLGHFERRTDVGNDGSRGRRPRRLWSDLGNERIQDAGREQKQPLSRRGDTCGDEGDAGCGGALRERPVRSRTLDYSAPEVRGRFRPRITGERRIDWASDTAQTILRKIHSADGSPGVLDEIGGIPVYLYGAHREGTLVGPPGEIIAQRSGAICRAAVDGAVWISHLRQKGPHEEHIKLPAALVLGDQLVNVPEVPLPFDATTRSETFREIWYKNRMRSATSISAFTTARWEPINPGSIVFSVTMACLQWNWSGATCPASRWSRCMTHESVSKTTRGSASERTFRNALVDAYATQSS